MTRSMVAFSFCVHSSKEWFGKDFECPEGSSKRIWIGLSSVLRLQSVTGIPRRPVVKERRKGAWPNTFYRAFSGRKCFLQGHLSRIEQIMLKTSAGERAGIN